VASKKQQTTDLSGWFERLAHDNDTTVNILGQSGRYATTLLLAAAALLLLAGCRSDMQNQPYQRPLAESDFYADKRAARPLVEGTVARGHERADSYFYTGKIGSEDGNYMPFPVTAEVMQRGQQRFNIYCSPCHGETGDGNGMIVQRGLKRPPSYHTERLRKAPIGYFFDVMTNGFGVMLDYSQQVKPEDRWAIAAYIKALQLSQGATRADVPPGQQIASEPPKGVVISTPYDTQGAGQTQQPAQGANQ
jgi:mono/diheme cytochrome c family protein